LTAIASLVDLFVNLARHLSIDLEKALTGANYWTHFLIINDFLESNVIESLATLRHYS